MQALFFLTFLSFLDKIRYCLFKKRGNKMAFGIERISMLITHITDKNAHINWDQLNEEQRVEILMNISGPLFVDALKCTDGSSPVLFQFSDENKMKLLNRLSTTYPTQMRSVICQKNDYNENLFDFINERNLPALSKIIHIATNNAKDMHIRIAAKKAKERG